jgi:hypothetical protein
MLTRKLALVTAFCGIIGTSEAQAPTVSKSLTCVPQTCLEVAPKEKAAGGLPSNNSWVKAGAQLAYKIGGRGDFKDDFLVSARTELERLNVGQPSGLKLPLIGNLSTLSSDLAATAVAEKTKELLNSAQGINLTFQPYYETSSKRLKTTFYGTAGWKTNAAKDFADTSQTVYLNQGRFSAGIAVEAFIVEDTDGKPQARPITFGFEPVYTVINAHDYKRAFGKEKPSNLKSLEVTLVIPIAGVGLLAQTIMSKDLSPTSRIGILFVKGNGSSTTPAAGKDREQPKQ